MAYIDLKLEQGQARIVLSRHNYVTQPGQLQRDCTGVLMECVSNRYTWLEYLLNGSSEGGRADFQYQRLRQAIKARGLPAFTADPNLTSADTKGLDSFKQAQYDNLVQEVLVSPEVSSLNWGTETCQLIGLMSLIATCPSEIRQDSRFYRWLLRTERKHTPPTSPKYFRNLNMAQRIDTLAALQRANGITPNLALIVGIGHIDIVDALKLDSEERFRRILEHPAREYFTGTEILYAVKYRRGKRGWVGCTLTDPRFLGDNELPATQTPEQAWFLRPGG